MEKKALAALSTIVVGLFSLLGFVALFSYAISALKSEVELPLLVVGGVIALLATVGFLVVAFSFFTLHDAKEALGLPSGSIRALIAMMLLVIFAIFAVYFFDRLLTKPEAIPVDFAKQIITLVGTLLTAICSFYFGTRTASTTVGSGSPTVTAVTPPTGTAGSTVDLKITGANLLLVTAVKLVQQATEIVASNVLSSAEQVTCRLTLDTSTSKGDWDVVVETSEGQKVTATGKFKVV